MKRLSGRQAAYVNKLERRTGSLWEGRYKSSPIQKDEYLLPCVRYIGLNPVRAGMVAESSEYRWSSYHQRVGIRKLDLLDLDECYLGLSKDDSKRIIRYQKYLSDGTSTDEIKKLRESIARSQLTGNKLFIDQIESRIGIRIEARGRGRPISNDK